MSKSFQNSGDASRIKRNIELKKLDEYLVESSIPSREATPQLFLKQTWPTANDSSARDSFYNSLDMDMFN